MGLGKLVSLMGKVSDVDSFLAVCGCLKNWLDVVEGEGLGSMVGVVVGGLEGVWGAWSDGRVRA